MIFCKCRNPVLPVTTFKELSNKIHILAQPCSFIFCQIRFWPRVLWSVCASLQFWTLSLCACRPCPWRSSMYRHHFKLFLQIPLIFLSLSVHVAVSHMQTKHVIQSSEGCSTKRSSPWAGKAQPAVSTLERWPGCCTSVSEIRAEQIRGQAGQGQSVGR